MSRGARGVLFVRGGVRETVGRLAGFQRWCYDARGRPAALTVTANATRRATTFGYDADDLLANLTTTDTATTTISTQRQLPEDEAEDVLKRRW